MGQRKMSQGASCLRCWQCWVPRKSGSQTPWMEAQVLLKLELVKSKADECLLSEEMVWPSLWPALPRGVEVIEGASGSTTLLREPIGLRNVSIVLEPRGRVVSTLPEAILLGPLCFFWLTLQRERMSGYTSGNCRSAETLPGGLGLIPEDEGVS